MKVFIDTSAFYAIIAPEDPLHKKASEILSKLDQNEAVLVTSNYVLLECGTLIQNRHGFVPAKTILTETVASCEVVWVNKDLYKESLSLWIKSQDRKLSLVDCTSFAVMHSQGIRKALAFDRHFAAQGFEVIA